MSNYWIGFITGWLALYLGMSACIAAIGFLAGGRLPPASSVAWWPLVVLYNFAREQMRRER